MKNISIIIEIYVSFHSSPGYVLRKHRVVPNVMVFYVFSFFSISIHWKLNTNPWLFIRSSEWYARINNWPELQFSKPWWCSRKLGVRWLNKQFETVSKSQESHFRKLRKVLWMTTMIHLKGWWMMVRTAVL